MNVLYRRPLLLRRSMPPDDYRGLPWTWLPFSTPYDPDHAAMPDFFATSQRSTFISRTWSSEDLQLATKRRKCSNKHSS